MKLVTEKGELTLPTDFSFEVEQNSAFFSEDGAASIAATIPATSSDQAKLGFPNRMARKNRFVNSFPASIQKGVFQKQGVLVVSSANDDSITCSMALEDSSFYSQFKDKNLKELFSAKVLRTYSTPQEWYSWLWQVYKNQVSSDFRLFPVAVALQDGKYQMNNEPVYANETYREIWPLAHSPRIVMEGGDKVSVPEGYGIAPFLKLYRFLQLLFELCGYTIGTSCFEDDEFLSNLVLVHNCSDVICNGKIDYSDLVPNKTISEILEWLRMKFHAQIVVTPASKVVDIVLLEDILSAGYDKDLTATLLGGVTKEFSQSSRVVMTPDTSLEGAAAASDTIESLIKKYGYVKHVDESSFFGITTPCLALRTNQFKYDRANADTSESFSPEDIVPPIVVADAYGTKAPYIGDRCHRNTSYNDSEKDEDQEIIVVYYYGLTEEISYSSSDHGRVALSSDGRYYAGTTQKYNNRGTLIPGAINLTPDDLVQRFFSKYNKHLRNNAVIVSGRFDLPIESLMKYDMYALKLLQGQKLLPVSLKYEVGKHIRCLEAKFRLIKDFSDGQEDAPVIAPEPIYQWQLNQSEITSKQAELQASVSGTVLWKYAEDDPYIQDESDIFIPSPVSLGEETSHIERRIYFFRRVPGPRGTSYDYGIDTFTLHEWFVSVQIVS